MRARTRIALALATAATFAAVSTTPAQAANVSDWGTFYEGFSKPAATGRVDSTYPNSWQPYPDGTGGRYYSDQIISVHDGVLDVALDGKRGAAGTFGTPDGAWGHQGGVFSLRMKSSGGAGNGIAVMLWPSSDQWGDGEIDFPEGNFGGNAHVYHHLMSPNDPAKSINTDTGASLSAWHTYSADWTPGESIIYYVDNAEVFRVTSNVPTSPHRFMFQVGNYGKPGHVLIDWVRTTEP